MYNRRVKKRENAFAQFNNFLTDKAIFSLNRVIHKEEKRRAEVKRKRQKESENAARAERAALRNHTILDPVLDDQIGGKFRMNNMHLCTYSIFLSSISILNANSDNQQNVPDFDDDAESYEDVIDEIIAEGIIIISLISISALKF